MRPSLGLLAACVGLAAACGTTGQHPITLDHFQGVYSTHFDGVPDRTRVCAVLTNHGTRPVGWVRLKLRAFSQQGELPGEWTSYWVYAQPVAPGQTVALSFQDAPQADQIELHVDRLGSGATRPRGRPLRAARGCSGQALRRRLVLGLGDRQPPDYRLIPILRRNAPAAAREIRIAQSEPAAP